MQKKKIVVALGHRALGTTLPEQKTATKKSAKAALERLREEKSFLGKEPNEGRKIVAFVFFEISFKYDLSRTGSRKTIFL